MSTPREKSPLPEKFSPEEDPPHNAASSRTASPTHYQRAIPAPSSSNNSRSCCSSRSGSIITAGSAETAMTAAVDTEAVVTVVAITASRVAEGVEVLLTEEGTDIYDSITCC